jgi:hypothetical protein
MTFEELAQGVGKQVERRRFIKRAGAGALTATLGMLGLAGTASAEATALVTVRCCGLCQTPRDCSGACIWCWNCCSGGTRYRCCEHYRSTGAACRGGYCSNIACSSINAAGSC